MCIVPALRFARRNRDRNELLRQPEVSLVLGDVGHRLSVLQREVEDCQSGEPATNRNDELQSLILGFGLSWPDDDLGRRTNISELWKEAKKQCFDCDRDELLDALYTIPREHTALIKCVSAGEGFHPISFERVRNTSDWTTTFLLAISA